MKLLLFSCFCFFILLLSTASAQITLQQITPSNAQTGLSPETDISFILTDDCNHAGDCGPLSTSANPPTRVYVRRSQNLEVQDKDLIVGCRTTAFGPSRTYTCTFIANYCSNAAHEGPVEIIIDAVDNSGTHYIFSQWYYETVSGNHFTSNIFPVKQIITSPLSSTQTLLTSFTYGYGHDLNVVLRTAQGQTINTYSVDYNDDNILELSRVFFDNLQPNTEYEYTATLTDFCGNTYSETKRFYSSAQPVISSLSNSNFIQGDDITMYGTGFGIKNPVEPLKYDDFETGNNDQTLQGWDISGNPHYSSVRTRVNGEQVIEQIYSSATGSGHQIGIQYSSLFSNIYATWWAYRDDYLGTALCSDNQKLAGNMGGNVITYQSPSMPQQRTDQYSNYQSGHLYSSNYLGLSGIQDYFPFDDMWMNTWHRIERYSNTLTRQNNAYLKRNQEMIAQINGDFIGNDYNYYNYFIMGHFVRLDDGGVHNPSTCSAQLKQYLGEMYVDITPARIELCNNQVYASATHCEIQIPHTTWNNNQITFSVNLGTFTGNEDLYLFVIDQEQEASDGFSIASVPVTEPTIYGVSDSTLTDGQTISISGAGFGVKNPVPPLAWDDFESGELNTLVTGVYPPVGTIPYARSVLTYYSDDDSYSGSQSAFNDAGTSGGLSLELPSEEKKVFASMKVKLWSSAGDLLHLGLKFLRFNSNDDDSYVHGRPSMEMDLAGSSEACATPSLTVGQRANTGLLPDVRCNDDSHPRDVLFNEWMHWEGWSLVGDVDVANGLLGSRYDDFYLVCNDVITYISGYPPYTGYRTANFVPHITKNCAELDDDTIKIWIDDIYVDNTFARVVLADTNSWENSQHYELQLPVSGWDDGTGRNIVFTINQGTFTSTDDVYLFVVDSDGVVSDGFGPLSFEDGGVSVPGDLDGNGVVNLADLDAVITLRDLLVLGRALLS